MLKSKNNTFSASALVAFLFYFTSLPLFAQSGSTYTLEELINKSHENYIELQQLNIDKEKTELELSQAKARRFPDVDLNVSLSHLGNPMDPVTLKAGEFGTYQTGTGEILIPPEDTKIFEGMESAMYQFKITIDQPIYTWGKIKNSIRLQTKALETRQLKIQQKKQELNTKIKIYYYSLYFLEQIEQTMEKQKKAAERLIYISKKNYENGFILYSEFLESKIKAKEIELAQKQMGKEKNQVLLDVKNFSMLDELTTENIDFSGIDFSITDYPLKSEKTLINQAVKQNLNLQLLNSLNQIAGLKQEIAKGKTYFKPDFGLQIELSYSGPRFPFLEKDWFGQDDYDLVSSIGITTKLYDGGKLANEIALSEKEQQHALYEFQKGKNRIEKFIAETLLKLSLNKDRIEYYTLKLESDREKTKLKKTQYENGVSSEIDYIKAQLELYGDEIKQYQEKIHFFSNYFTLMSAVGHQK